MSLGGSNNGPNSSLNEGENQSDMSEEENQERGVSGVMNLSKPNLESTDLTAYPKRV